MTEAEWLACNDPAHMTRGHVGKWWMWSEPVVRLDNRRTRLLAVACARLMIDHLDFPGVREALDVFERFADGACDRQQLRAARVVAERCLEDCDRRTPRDPDREYYPAAYPARRKAAILFREAGRTRPNVPIGQRWGYWDCLGRQHRPTAAAFVRDIAGNPFRPVIVDPAWRASVVLDLARHVYDGRAFDRLPILADALLDAGCEDAAILDHCRGPGPHVRGCWVVDLVLGKS